MRQSHSKQSTLFQSTGFKYYYHCYYYYYSRYMASHGGHNTATQLDACMYMFNRHTALERHRALNGLIPLLASPTSGVAHSV